ncbi:hypothetical protein K501DRAFT_332961 [Backusella circina FSU 941]|nr:hypothetical protein K501DRAFT_332961 [Backusella circina FSU 941]
MSLKRNQSFNNAELTKGFHLLTESSHSVKVKNTIPESSAHLYPRLAGSNWTCIISRNKIILGRSTEKTQVDVDFGSSKAISRKHCEIRFSASRARWELVVYGGMGVKVNHVLKKKADKPTVLTTGSLIDINNTSFVFINPTNKPPPVQNEAQSESEANTPAEEIVLDSQLEAALVELLEKKEKMETQAIISALNEKRNKPIEKGTLLHVLVMSNRFELENDSINLSANESDVVQWKLVHPPQGPRDMSLVETPSLEPSSLEEEWSIMDNSARDDDDDAGGGSCDIDFDDGSGNGEPPPSTPPPIISRGLSIESMYSMWSKSDHKRRLSDDEEEEEEDKVVDIYKRIRTAILKPNEVLT